MKGRSIESLKLLWFLIFGGSTIVNPFRSSLPLVLFASFLIADVTPAEEPPLTVVFRPDHKFFSQEGELKVGVHLANPSGHEVKTSGMKSLDDGLVVMDRNGKALKKKGLVDNVGTKLPAVIPVGARVSRGVDLRAGFPDLTQPGCYRAAWKEPKIRSHGAEIRIIPKIDVNKDKRLLIRTNKGDITVELSPDKAPNTCYNFLALATSHFYDGLTFHRIVPGFVIQGGDPKGDGTGGAGYKLRLEKNDLKHEAGSLAMAREDDPDSASSQFYIALAKQPKLDGKYTVFGRVVEGMEAVKAVAATATDENGRPKEPVTISTIELVPSQPTTQPATP